ncbi:hypothetical protein GE061_003791 [Apolygus lucorum]|uniref:Uncharacterized protein n=1 Tax=Apolygus lucorum TaxID=248454 RepID=A0A6A4JM45_APOLU|nr:hypothetical protein GE061_003791 [Apolygus lucorum]
MKVVVVLFGLVACAVEFASSETCEQMIDNFRIPDSLQIPDMKTKKEAVRDWVRSQAQNDDSECLDTIVDMMIKGMEGEEEPESKRSLRNEDVFPLTTVDGETHYEIEGKTIDLEKADILEDNDEQSIFAPTEVEGAKVTVLKKRHQVVLDYKGHRMVTSNNHNKAFNFVAYN